MGLSKFITSFPWQRYSRKLRNRIAKPRNSGFFLREDAEQRGMRLVKGTEGERCEGNRVSLFWLVDPEDGTIVDAKFQVFGQSALVGAADVLCDLVVGKNYDQAKRIGTDLLDKELSDRSGMPAFPAETFPHLNLVISAVDHAAEKCVDIPLPTTYIAPPAPTDIGEVLEGGYPGFDEMEQAQKLVLIEQVLDSEVRPYIAMDGGGIEVINLLKGRSLVIAYQGNCVSCFSAVGATLSYIQQVIRAKVHPEMDVVPQM
jgi:NifU-like protein